MSTTQVVRLGQVAQSGGLRRFLERYFYFIMSLIVATMVVNGFSRMIGDRRFWIDLHQSAWWRPIGRTFAGRA